MELHHIGIKRQFSGIYATRPTACRNHSNDYCEFDAPAEDGFDLFFPDYDSLLAYCKKRFKRWP